MNNLMCFTAVDFVDDVKVSGYLFWYLCELEGVKEGNKVLAPLGKHNRLQIGIVRQIRYGDEFNAPFPLHSIKSIRQIIGTEKLDV